MAHAFKFRGPAFRGAVCCAGHFHADDALLAGGSVHLVSVHSLPRFGRRACFHGMIALLPFAFVTAWAVYLFANWRAGRPMSWTWGRTGVTVPLFLLALLGIATLDLSSGRNLFIQLGGLIIFWLLYLYLLNRRPNVVLLLAIVVLVQGFVSIAQFLTQADLGLIKLGEIPLDPMQSGISVLFARGQKWLRAYGLTAHPNLLGAMLAAILLLLLPAFKRALGRKRLLLAFVYAVGLLGLLTSFSRSAILAFVAGLTVWLILEYKQKPRSYSLFLIKKTLRSPWLWLTQVCFIVVLLVFGDLALSRVVALDSDVEAISINQRLADWKVAIDLIRQHPIRGVGLGQYIVAAKEISPFAVTVHNVPLLVAAELGVGGLLILLWLMISGLRSRPAALAPWIAVIIIGFFDVTLWLSGNWQTSVLFALIAANLSQDITAGQD